MYNYEYGEMFSFIQKCLTTQDWLFEEVLMQHSQCHGGLTQKGLLVGNFQCRFLMDSFSSLFSFGIIVSGQFVDNI